MYSIQKNITGLTNISRLYVSSALLTLTLWLVSFQHIQKIFADTNHLYRVRKVVPPSV